MHYATQNGQVKFEVKIAAGFCPNDILIEEANSVKANWIVMDRSLSLALSTDISKPYKMM